MNPWRGGTRTPPAFALLDPALPRRPGQFSAAGSHKIDHRYAQQRPAAAELSGRPAAFKTANMPADPAPIAQLVGAAPLGEAASRQRRP